MARPVRPSSVAGSGQYGGWLLVAIIFVLPMLALTCVWIASSLIGLLGGPTVSPTGVWGPHILARALFVDHDAPAGGWPPPPSTSGTSAAPARGWPTCSWAPSPVRS